MDEFEEERKKLRLLQQIFEKAVENNQMETLRPHVDKDFSFVSFTDRSFDNFNDFKKQWEATRTNMVGNGFFTTKLNPKPSLFVGDTAVAHGQSENHMQDASGATFTFSSHWTVVFKRHDDEWKVLRVHNSLDPFGNPMLERKIKVGMMKVMVLGFIVGVIFTGLFVTLF